MTGLKKTCGKLTVSRLWLICTVVVAATLFSSCGDEYYEYSPLEGRWELVEVDGYPVREIEVSEFTFYSDGTGIYGQYNNLYQWSTFPIRWEVDYAPGGAEYLYVYPYGGGCWRYLMRLHPTWLELTDLDTGQRLVYNSY